MIRGPRALFLAVVMASLTLCGILAAGPGLWKGSPDFLLGGIQIREPDLDRWFAALESAGMNAVAVTDYARQRGWDSADLTFDPPDPGTRDEIRRAKARGLKVALVLRVALDHASEASRFFWHGMIHPKSDELLALWQERYASYVLAWAEVAQREGVDVLMIGSELNSLTSTSRLAALPRLEDFYLDRDQQSRYQERLLAVGDGGDPGRLAGGEGAGFDRLEGYLDARAAAHEAWARQTTFGGTGNRASLERVNQRRLRLERGWRVLIERVRQVYDGRLGYAANFDRYRQVSFWDRLDFIGINAYFPLRDHLATLPPGEGELYRALEDGWGRALEEIEIFRQRRGLEEMPVLFSELGYTFHANTTLAPWAGNGFSAIPVKGEDETRDRLVIWDREPVTEHERALAVRALGAAYESRGGDYLEGLLYWKLSTEPGHREIEPFVAVLGRVEEDPLFAELRSLAR